MLNVYKILGEITVTCDLVAIGILTILLLVLIVQVVSIGNFHIRQKKSDYEKVSTQTRIPGLEVPQVKILTFKDRLAKGLERSRSEVWDKLGSVILGRTLDEEVLSQLEELLYGADIGTDLVHELLERLKKVATQKKYSAEEFKNFLYMFMYEQMKPIQDLVDNSLYAFNPNAPDKKIQTIMIVGVNGAGKTTTIGKLATRLTRQGARVMVGACDTFRAAAVDQLQIWCDKAGAKMIRAKEGTNPSGVAYETLDQAIKERADYCILDTAGRLHTKGNLMEELAKNKRVLSKLDQNAPQQTLLVLDAITGQNAIKQAEEFHKILGISGLIFTKCDGSSKAGSAVSITRRLKVPIVYIGVGETVDDLDIFKVDEYLKALLGL